MNTITATITGTAPLLMHNGQMANPLNKYAQELKKLTSKRQKTEDDYIAMMRIEFLGGLYFDKNVGVHLPAINVEGCIRDGGKVKKRGKQIQQGVTCLEMHVPLIYSGPRTPEQLWDIEDFRDVRAVKIGGTSTTMRCRPVFREWSATFTLQYYPDIIDPDSIKQAIQDAGQRVGLCDYTPRFGRFELTNWKAN